jgi:hypothetical protein
MTYLLVADCEIVYCGRKTACLEISRRHPKGLFKLYVVSGEVEVRGGKIV